MRKAKIAVAACFSLHGAQVEIYTVTVLPRPQTHTHTSIEGGAPRRSNYLRIC